MAHHATIINGSFQNGGLVTQRSVTWESTHVPEQTHMMLRKGDSLLLSPVPVNAEGGGNLVIAGETYILGSGNTMAYEFSQAGDVEVTTEYVDALGMPTS